MFAVTADVLTANFGNFGDALQQRRAAHSVQQHDDGRRLQRRRKPWYGMYSALGAANDALRAIKAGVKLGSEDATTKVRSPLPTFTRCGIALESRADFRPGPSSSTRRPTPRSRSRSCRTKDVITAAQGKWGWLDHPAQRQVTRVGRR